jgi:DNA-binding transcriptional LysR family regulator
MDLHQLRVLRELGARGSVAAVARALYVTPSAVSQHLSALQRHIGVALTEKRGRVLALTEAGRALAAAAVKVSAAFEAAEQAIAAYHDDPHQTVTVSAFHSAGLAY